MPNILLFLILTISYLPKAAMAIEEPKFDVLEQFADFQLRQYQPSILAEVLVEGDLDEASGKGFRLIADYIFGNNRTPAGASEKIAMTAPVTVEPIDNTIAMTAPVTFHPQSGQWQVRFVMPRQYTLATLPIPNNSKVQIREIPGRKVAVLTFSGLAGESKTAKKVEELLAWLASKQLKPAGTPELARYNPPWTLPFLRRNEVMVEYVQLLDQ